MPQSSTSSLSSSLSSCRKESECRRSWKEEKANRKNWSSRQSLLDHCSRRNSTFCLLLLLVIFADEISFSGVSGGICWSDINKNGLCKEVINMKSSKEECCNTGSVSTAWSDQDLDDGALFFWRVLGDGVPCTRCKENCEGVQCGNDKKCVIRNGKPKCVCAPKCKRTNDKIRRGPICGTDGRSYKSLCRLKKRACRTKDSTLSVDYYGPCQNTCENVQCGQGKYCIQDQNLQAHCAKCVHYCIPKDLPAATQRICGADKITYQSICHLNEAACRKGRSIPVAYKGRCKANATCKTVRCWEKQKCLVEVDTGYPRCTSCSECPNMPGNQTLLIKEMKRTLCGTNNQTYDSWCHMVQDSCRKGYVVETKYPGTCENGDEKSQKNN